MLAATTRALGSLAWMMSAARLVSSASFSGVPFQNMAMLASFQISYELMRPL